MSQQQPEQLCGRTETAEHCNKTSVGDDSNWQAVFAGRRDRRKKQEIAQIGGSAVQQAVVEKMTKSLPLGDPKHKISLKAGVTAVTAFNKLPWKPSAQSATHALPTRTITKLTNSNSTTSIISQDAAENHGYDDVGGFSLLVGLYKFQERVRQGIRFGQTVMSDIAGHKPHYDSHQLEAALYDFEHHDDDDPKIMNIGEIFGVPSDWEEVKVLRFHMDWRVRMLDIVMVSCVLCSNITAPLTLFYAGLHWDAMPGRRPLLFLDLWVDIVYGICLLLKFRVSYLHPIQRQEVVDPKIIREHFIKDPIWWINFASVFSYVWFVTGATLLLNMVKLFRLGPFFCPPDSLWRWEDYILVRLGRPILLLVIGSHWVACLLFTLGGYQQELELREASYATDLEFGGFHGTISGGVSLYLMAFVEALYMLTGALDNPLGDGGPRDKNFGALVMVALFGPTGCVVVALFISAIVREQSKMDALDMKHEETKAFMIRALQILDIPPPLQRRVLSTHIFKLMAHDDEAFNSLFGGGRLSKSLESALLVYLYRGTVCSSKYFLGKDPNYIIAVINVLQDQVFLPGDYVARRGEVADSMYFVKRGLLSILVPSPDPEEAHDVAKAKPVGHMKTGQHFGEIALVKETTRTAWVRADKYVIVSALYRDKIDSIWTFYPEEREELKQMVEETARRDQQRKVRQRWAKALEGATLTPHKIRGLPSSARSQSQNRQSKGKERRCSAHVFKTQSAPQEHPSAQISSDNLRAKAISFDVSLEQDVKGNGIPASVEAVAADRSSLASHANHGLSRAPEDTMLCCAGNRLLLQRVDEVLSRQKALEGVVMSALAGLGVTASPTTGCARSSVLVQGGLCTREEGAEAAVEEKDCGVARPVLPVPEQKQIFAMHKPQEEKKRTIKKTKASSAAKMVKEASEFGKSSSVKSENRRIVGMATCRTSQDAGMALEPQRHFPKPCDGAGQNCQLEACHLQTHSVHQSHWSAREQNYMVNAESKAEHHQYSMEGHPSHRDQERAEWQQCQLPQRQHQQEQLHLVLQQQHCSQQDIYMDVPRQSFDSFSLPCPGSSAMSSDSYKHNLPATSATGDIAFTPLAPTPSDALTSRAEPETSLKVPMASLSLRRLIHDQQSESSEPSPQLKEHPSSRWPGFRRREEPRAAWEIEAEVSSSSFSGAELPELAADVAGIQCHTCGIVSASSSHFCKGCGCKQLEEQTFSSRRGLRAQKSLQEPPESPPE
eukprot:TRINITY_DN11587_c0_g1_i3.p1 TRINITY_DN11587_c0_g1~~TRINITY_DN11587_c0_g1_i3.p1  ORF type:complete len:1234 (-),score=210.28 TRINITY_DN11587_c0_g1_i3:555-4256(-)